MAGTPVMSGMTTALPPEAGTEGSGGTSAALSIGGGGGTSAVLSTWGAGAPGGGSTGIAKKLPVSGPDVIEGVGAGASPVPCEGSGGKLLVDAGLPSIENQTR